MATPRRTLGYVSQYVAQNILTNYGTATGGTSSSITVGGQNYTLLTFSSDANLVVSSAGLFDVLLIGGGGGSGGGDAGNRTGGGGGGGDVVGITNTLTIYLAAGTYAVDVGAGGAGGRRGTSASRSTIHGTMLGAIGGGGAAGYSTPPSGQEALYAYLRYNSWNGGANIGNFTGTFPADFAVTAKSGGGVTGGAANADTASNSSGGGGGCGSAGGNATFSTGTGGAGGNGIDISGFIGGSTYYAGAGGGGGANTNAGAAGLGGVAGVTSGVGNNGVNYGAGGGGKNGSDSGGNGQAGAVFVRFKV